MAEQGKLFVPTPTSSSMTRVLVTGSRAFKADHLEERRRHVIRRAFKCVRMDTDWDGRFTLIYGKAEGADTLAAQEAEKLGWLLDPFPADWDVHGGPDGDCWCRTKTGRCKAAGIRRNQEMLDSGVDTVVAFSDDLRNSRGTRDMVDRAVRAGKPVVWWNSEGVSRKVLRMLDSKRQPALHAVPYLPKLLADPWE